MNRLLHIVASPRGLKSRTLALSTSFLEEMARKHPSLVVDELDVFSEPLPDMFAETVEGKYLLMGGRHIPPELKDRWKDIEAYINRFLAANVILLSVPMWNFGMPYRLKHFFDIVIQPRHLFRSSKNGVEGLAPGKKVFVISTRGWDYAPSRPFEGYDHLEPHLRTVFGFLGIADPVFYTGQPMDSDDEELTKKLLLALSFAWRVAGNVNWLGIRKTI